MNKNIQVWLILSGWIVFGASIAAAADVAADDLPVMTSQTLRINYAKPEIKDGETSTGQLWYRLNGGHWRKGQSFKAGDPLEYVAESEGVYDFVVEFGNDAEASGPVDESTGFSCFVDYTKPLVQLADVRYGSGKFLVQWKAYDANLPIRPVEIYLVNEKGKNSISLGKFSNNGAAVVSVDPKLLPGKIKIVVTDRAGNSASEISKTEYTGPQENKAVESPAVKPVTSRPVTSRPAVKDDEADIRIPSAKRAVKMGDVRTAIREYKTGMEYEYRGQKDLAILHFKRSIEEAPEFVPAHIDLGNVLVSMEHYDEAGSYFLEALSWDDKSERAWKGLSIAKAKMGMYRQAKSCLEKVVALNKTDIEGWLLLGDAYWAIGKSEEAKGAWKKAKE
jgi:tetratricopeptide (TPR) repeat protein